MQKEISLHMLQLRRTSCLWMNEIKKETKWNYQIQGLMGITGIHCRDLVIYTLKGILTVKIKFDSDLRNEMLQKLRNLFVEYIVQELFHHDILRGCPGVPVHSGIPIVFISTHGVVMQFINVSFLSVPVHEDTTHT